MNCLWSSNGIVFCFKNDFTYKTIVSGALYSLIGQLKAPISILTFQPNLHSKPVILGWVDPFYFLVGLGSVPNPIYIFKALLFY